MTTHGLSALITGGTSGIGRATANKLAQLGIHVLVVGRNLQRGEKTVAEIRAAGGKADFISSDLRDASSARKVARRAVELGSGHVDILINNAGIFPFGPTDETTVAVKEQANYVTGSIARLTGNLARELPEEACSSRAVRETIRRRKRRHSLFFNERASLQYAARN